MLSAVEPAQETGAALGALGWWIDPPLGSGAPRFAGSSRVDAAADSYAASLGDRVDDALVEDAVAGYERARERRSSIEGRATTLLQGAGLTGTLVLANGTLLVGDDSGLGDPARVAVTLGLVVASTALVCAGVYSLLAIARTFTQVAPNSPRRLLARSKVADDGELLRQKAAALLVAQRRTSIVGDWKLDRLKRATAAFLVGVGGVAVASIALVAEALFGG